MTETEIKKLVEKQRAFFNTGKTLDVNYRIQALNRLQKALIKYEREVLDALKADLNKSETEAYMCEHGLSLAELNFVKKHLRSWNRRRVKPTPLVHFAAKSFTVREPYGVSLIMSPWNYPVLLTIDPLISAISAGNCCIVKPSAYSPATTSIIAKIIREAFDEEYVAVVEGGRAENTSLLDQKFDYIFFTGSVLVGKTVMAKASASVTPITLELGGKSPCIIDSTANLKLAAKRLVFGKYLNVGQTCVAPDYVLIEESIKDQFIDYVKKYISEMFGDDPIANDNYGKMINQKHFERVLGLINPDKVIVGGYGDEKSLKIAPTIMDNVSADDLVMQEEIFGPVMPVLTVKDMNEAFNFVNSRPSPLALYLFTSDKATENRFLNACKFGGGCVNDTIVHLATSQLAFGGIGDSGIGSYHGKKGFETFSHEKSILKKYTWLDLPMRYQPYQKLYYKLIRFVLK